MVSGVNRDVMALEEYMPWEVYPKFLRFGEVRDPLAVVRFFFDSGWPEEQTADLWKWRHFVVTELVFTDERFGPGTLLFVYDENIKLVEAMFLLLEMYKRAWPKTGLVGSEQLAAEKECWRFFPDNLAAEELANPYLVMGDFFTRFSLPACRDMLHAWLRTALLNRSADEGMPVGELIAFYEYLLKLYSAAWLLYQRESGEPALRVGAAVYPPVHLARADFRLQAIGPEPTKAELLGLEEVKKLIVERFSAVRLILHLATHNSPFTYYLLILLDDAEKTTEHEVTNKVEDHCQFLANVFVLTHKVNSARTGLEAGQRFWSRAFAKGHLLFAAEGLELPVAKEVGKAQLMGRAAYHWDRWGLQGKAFLEGAERYQADGNYRLAVFLLHQAVESTLKAVVEAIVGYRVQLHNLSRLLRLTLLCTDELKTVFRLDTEDGAQLFALLQSSYAQSRYGHEFNPDGESVRSLLELVERFYSVAVRLYEQYLSGLR
jgi:HEPN domain-containing protein